MSSYFKSSIFNTKYILFLACAAFNSVKLFKYTSVNLSNLIVSCNLLYTYASIIHLNF